MNGTEAVRMPLAVNRLLPKIKIGVRVPPGFGLTMDTCTKLAGLFSFKSPFKSSLLVEMVRVRRLIMGWVPINAILPALIAESDPPELTLLTGCEICTRTPVAAVPRVAPVTREPPVTQVMLEYELDPASVSDPELPVFTKIEPPVPLTGGN